MNCIIWHSASCMDEGYGLLLYGLIPVVKIFTFMLFSLGSNGFIGDWRNRVWLVVTMTASLVMWITWSLNPVRLLMIMVCGIIRVPVLYYRSLRTAPTLPSKGLKAWIDHMENTMTCFSNIMYIYIYCIHIFITK